MTLQDVNVKINICNCWMLRWKRPHLDFFSLFRFTVGKVSSYIYLSKLFAFASYVTVWYREDLSLFFQKHEVNFLKLFQVSEFKFIRWSVVCSVPTDSSKYHLHTQRWVSQWPFVWSSISPCHMNWTLRNVSVCRTKKRPDWWTKPLTSLPFGLKQSAAVPIQTLQKARDNAVEPWQICCHVGIHALGQQHTLFTSSFPWPFCVNQEFSLVLVLLFSCKRTLTWIFLWGEIKNTV